MTGLWVVEHDRLTSEVRPVIEGEGIEESPTFETGDLLVELNCDGPVGVRNIGYGLGCGDTSCCAFLEE